MDWGRQVYSDLHLLNRSMWTPCYGIRFGSTVFPSDTKFTPFLGESGLHSFLAPIATYFHPPLFYPSLRSSFDQQVALYPKFLSSSSTLSEFRKSLLKRAWINQKRLFILSSFKCCRGPEAFSCLLQEHKNNGLHLFRTEQRRYFFTQDIIYGICITRCSDGHYLICHSKGSR